MTCTDHDKGVTIRSHTARRAGRRGAVAILLLAVLAGCSNNPYPSGESAGPVVYRALADDPKTLDPSVSYNVDEAAIIDLIYPSYFRYHYLKRNPFVLELSLGAVEPVREAFPYTVAEKGRVVRKPGERWTFRIKRGLRFQDDLAFPSGKGREIVAADFLTSFRRMADPSVSCPVLSFFEDKIVGLHEYVEHNRQRAGEGKKADYQAPIAGLQLDPKDPCTFRILLNQPYPQLRYLMTMHFTTPLAHEAVGKYGTGLSRHPVGSGAYLLSEFRPKQRIVLKANPNRFAEYYPSEGAPGDREAGLLRDAGKRLPLADTIVYSIIREGVTGWNLFLQGYEDSWGVSQTNYQQVMSRQGQLSPEMERRGVRLLRDVTPNLWYFAFNMEDPVFGGYTPERRKLRQAVSLSIDAQAFIDLFSQGHGVPAQWVVPPGIYGYDPEYRNPYRRPDVDRAKKLLSDAGYPKGIDPQTGQRLALYFDTTAQTAAGRQYATLLVRQIKAIGIDVEMRSWRSNVWQDRVDKGEFQFIQYGWFADYPDPENFAFLLYGPNRRPGPNSAAYNNPGFNRLFEQMRSMDDGPDRLAIINRMRDVVQEDCPWVFQEHSEDLSIHYDWLMNVKPHPVANDTAKYRRVDSEKRARLQEEWNQPVYWPAAVLLLLFVVSAMPAAAVVRNRRRRRVRRET